MPTHKQIQKRETKAKKKRLLDTMNEKIPYEKRAKKQP